jgi:aryl carrier-like protein
MKRRALIRMRRTGVVVDFAALTARDLDTFAWFVLLLAASEAA